MPRSMRWSRLPLPAQRPWHSCPSNASCAFAANPQHLSALAAGLASPDGLADVDKLIGSPDLALKKTDATETSAQLSSATADSASSAQPDSVATQGEAGPAVLTLETTAPSTATPMLSGAVVAEAASPDVLSGTAPTAASPDASLPLDHEAIPVGQETLDHATLGHQTLDHSELPAAGPDTGGSEAVAGIGSDW